MARSGKDPSDVNLMRLIGWLESGRQLDVRETARKLGVTPRTFQRYIQKLEALRIPLDYEEGPNQKRRYFHTNARRTFPMNIGKTQVVALNVALGWLEQFEGNVLFESLDLLRKEISRWLKERAEDEGTRWREQKFYALPFLPYHYRSEGDAFDKVVTALLRQHKLQFRYQKAPTSGGQPSGGQSPKTTYKVRPYTLVFYKGAFYLLAQLDKVAPWGDPIVFSLARMTGAKVLRAEPYDYPERWDPESAFQQHTGMLPGEKQLVEARFSPGFFHYLKKERRWPPGNRIVLERDHVRFSARLAVNDELLNWFLGFGADVEIVRPEKLRDELAAKARAIAAVYRQMP